MGKVAFFLNGQLIYWRSILWAVAVLAAMLMAVALRLWQKKPLTPLLASFPLAILLGVFCARLVHWYFHFELYGSLFAALTDLGGGGYSLPGAFAGVLLALLAVRALRLTRELPSLLDAVAPAAAFGIAVGRWADYFTTADRGWMVLESAALHRLPWATELVRRSGSSEWHFATFAVQSLWAGLVFVILLLTLLLPGRRKRREGDVFLLFLLLYCAGEVLLDSTRYDRLFLRSNGFVSPVQIFCALVLTAVAVYFSVRAIRVRGFRRDDPVQWAAGLFGLVTAGVMEWYVQRHGAHFLYAYGIMALGLLLFLFTSLLLCRSAWVETEDIDTSTTDPMPSRRLIEVLRGVTGGALALFALWLLPWMAVSVGADSGPLPLRGNAAETASRFSASVNRLVASATEDLVRIPVYIPKNYSLSEDTVVAPRPDPEAYGRSASPADTRPVMDAAAALMDGQDFFWDPDTEILPDSSVWWYRDETILSITWKEVIGRSVYNFTEVKIAHPSQFRRYFADNSFANPIQYTTTQMANTVNAVTAMSGDFYKYRPSGTVVYNRTLWRIEPRYLDTCYVDGSGDLNFVRAGALRTEQEVRDYVADHDILYSLSFGPILIQDGVDVCPGYYLVGEIGDLYSRAAICQLGPCHYLLLTVNTDSGYNGLATLRSLTDALLARGIRNAYTLDGGQTATIVVGGEVFNHIDYGSERSISDIIYFATAIPEEERGVNTLNGGN